MPKLIFLGTSNAIADERHENTHMVVVGNQRTVLIDCVDGTILRLKKVGVDFNRLSDLILTHFHPDHVSGVPQLLLNMRLLGRILPLRIYGLQYTLDRIEELMGLYSWSMWPNPFPVEFIRVPEQDLVPVLQCEEFNIFASPVKHLIPTIGVRFEFQRSGKVLAYSCDTEPCDEVIRLSEGADVLIHEAAGESIGHSSAKQAGEIARKAEVGRLYLIHYPTGKFSKGDLVAEASTAFPGEVALAKDLMTLDFS